ncbi:hypothetical protein ACQ86B_06095 [Mycolicibacterium aichiense]|uniref:hypothetical protein n=1 Tax=Mycolicibacterium aichiense TaxID=1799 RepID=UPI003D67E0FF
MGNAMTVLRVNFLPEFYFGDDAVLLTLDGSGTNKIKTAVIDARNNGSSQLIHDGVTQEFVIEADAATIELSPGRVIWRLDPAKAAEISDDLEALSAAGHFYVDITKPAETLVISRDEYTDVVYPWISPA